MYKIVRMYLPKIIKNNNTKITPLGRWNTKDNSDIKSILANYDNCGDIICKDPKEVIKIIDKTYSKK